VRDGKVGGILGNNVGGYTLSRSPRGPPGQGLPPYRARAAQGTPGVSLAGGTSVVPEVGVEEAKTLVQAREEGGRPEGTGRWRTSHQILPLGKRGR
jgi:hypothetical protein